MLNFFTEILNIIKEVPPIAFIFPNEGGVFLRGGRYKKTIYAGVYFKIPFYDSVWTVEIKEQIINLPNQSVMTSDGQELAISGAIKYEVKDPKKALLDVLDYDTSLQNLAMGVLASRTTATKSKSTSIAKTYKYLVKEVLEELQIEAENWGLDIQDFWLTDFCKHRVFRIMTIDTPK